MTFEQRLAHRIASASTHLCVGLDPRPDLIDGDVYDFLRHVVDDVAEEAAAFKPNIAYFEAMGAAGYQILEKILIHIPKPVPIILDAKRSDIPETQTYYARAYFENWNVDAVTLNPYLGVDSCEPFFRYADKGVYVLAVTSNPGASDFQLKKNHDRYLFQDVVDKTATVRPDGATVGLVVGLTQASDEVFSRIPDVPLLIPGLGAQGGELGLLSLASRRAPIVVNVSRSLLYDSGAEGFRRRAKTFKEKIDDAFRG